MVFVEDPWSRIVGVHWQDDGPPPDPGDGTHHCGSYWQHTADPDSFIEVEQDGVVTRYPWQAGNIRLTGAGVAFGPIGANRPYNIIADNVVSYDIEWRGHHRPDHTPLPGSLPKFIYTETAGFGWTPMREATDPHNFPPPPAEPQETFYSATGSYFDEDVVGILHLELDPTNADLAFFLMGSGTFAQTPEYAAWYNYYFLGGGGPPPYVPPGGFDPNDNGFYPVDFTIKLTCAGAG
jgi:hypothetical protein